MKPTLEVDVVLVNYRGWEAVVRAVHHLRSAAPASVEGWSHGLIHVVDNSEDAGEARALTHALEGMREVRLQVMPRNLGFAAGCNAAWVASTAPYVLLLNPDTLITAQAVCELAVALEENPRAGAASPRTWWDGPGGWVLPCPTPQGPMARIRRAIGSRRNAAAWADAQVLQTRQRMATVEPFAVDMLAGALLMLRRAAVQATGRLFDSAYFMYFEDAELSGRLRAAGWELIMAPQVDAVHTWQHLPHKAALMSRGEAVFLQRQHPTYSVLRRVWPGLEAMGRLPAGSSVLVEPLAAARELGEVTALSPVPSGDPAWVRWGPAQAITPAEWRLLAPGHYWARTARGWVGFEKPLSPSAPP